MAGFVAKKWIKKSIDRLDTVFGGKKQESETDPKLDPVEAYNAYMRDAFRILAQDPYLTEDERQLYRNGFEKVDAVQIELYDLYG